MARGALDMAFGSDSTTLVRLRHKLQKPSNDAAFKRLEDWLFCQKSPHILGLRSVCNAVVLGLSRETAGIGATSPLAQAPTKDRNPP
jgi:hypothetical protein